MYVSSFFIRDLFPQTRYIVMDRAPLIPTIEINEFDWSNLLGLKSNNNPLKPAVSEHDVKLFFDNITIEDIDGIVIPEVEDPEEEDPEEDEDFGFVYLEEEAATRSSNALKGDAY